MILTKPTGLLPHKGGVRLEPGSLRLSFAGLTPEEIGKGLAILGRTIRGEREIAARDLAPSPAMV